jgi:DNA invertase Pin-like site-specific DNA recombinase
MKGASVMCVYGYARVSTKKQTNGNSLEEQKAILESKSCSKIITEQFTGSTTDRPELVKLLKQLAPGDTLIVTKLDRLARSVQEGSKLIQDLIKRDVTVIVDNLGTISNKPMDKLMLNILLAFAEFERSMIVERTQAGKEIAKSKPGFKDGRPPKFTQYQIESALKLLEEHSYNQVAAMTGISKPTLIRAKRKTS